MTELSLHLPSLDEVFMTLTGRSTNSDSDLDPTGHSSNNHKEVAA